MNSADVARYRMTGRAESSGMESGMRRVRPIETLLELFEFKEEAITKLLKHRGNRKLVSTFNVGSTPHRITVERLHTHEIFDAMTTPLIEEKEPEHADA